MNYEGIILLCEAREHLIAAERKIKEAGYSTFLLRMNIEKVEAQIKSEVNNDI